MDIVEQLRAAPTRLSNIGENAERLILNAADEIERLRAALKPFADLLQDEMCFPGRIEGEPLEDDDVAEVGVALGDMRRARELLEPRIA